MANFLLTYHGGGMPDSPEEGAKVVAAWNAWFQELGDAVVDGGNPCSPAMAISPDGSVMDATQSPSGYSVIRAADMAAAIAAAKGCPVLTGGAVVLVSETFDAM